LAAAAPAFHFADHAAGVGLRAGEACVPRGRAHLFGRRADGVDAVGGADVGQDFHRALVEHVGLGQDRRRRMCADEQRLYAEFREQHRCGQARAAAADDEHRYVDLRHERKLP